MFSNFIPKVILPPTWYNSHEKDGYELLLEYLIDKLPSTASDNFKSILLADINKINTTNDHILIKILTF